MSRKEHQITSELIWKLKHAGGKIRGLGFLIGLQQTDPLPLEPAEEVYEGIGLLLDQLGQDLIQTADALDEEKVQRASTHARREEDD